MTGVQTCALPISLRKFLDHNRDADEALRLERLLKAIEAGEFPGVHDTIVPRYIGKGTDSWKHIATGIDAEDGDGSVAPRWSRDFETSDYRKFHDAAKAHKHDVVRVIFPEFGIRLA